MTLILEYGVDDCQLVTDARARNYTFCRHEDADCPPNIQLFWRQHLCSCCHKRLEQFAIRITKSGLIIPSVRRSLKTLLFGQPDHGAL